MNIFERTKSINSILKSSINAKQYPLFIVTKIISDRWHKLFKLIKLKQFFLRKDFIFKDNDKIDLYILQTI